jgi:chemotaxis signal transduction protein
MSVYTGFRCEKRLFAIETKNVVEIIEASKIQYVPKAPVYIKGLVNNRGNIIPVFDVRGVLSINSNNKITHIIVTACNDISLGLASEVCPIILPNIPFKENKEGHIIKGRYKNLGLIDLVTVIEKFKI